MVDKVEALVDALAFVHKAYQGDSLAYRLRNPALLKSFGRPGKHGVDEEGYRVFTSYLGGYRSAVFDAIIKIGGKSNSGLLKTDKLKNYLGTMGLKQDAELTSVVSFLKKALQDPSISLQTPLSYFAEVKK